MINGLIRFIKDVASLNYRIKIVYIYERKHTPAPIQYVLVYKLISCISRHLTYDRK